MDDHSKTPVLTPSGQSMNPRGEAARKAVRTIRPVRTIIADDCPFGLKALARILELEGNFALIGTAMDGSEAVRQILAKQPELVLMDYRMPLLDGMEATRYAKQVKDPPIVIIVTSDNSLKCAELARVAGADGLADKGGDLHGQLHVLFQKFFGLRTGTMLSFAPPKPFRPSDNG